MKSEVKNKMKLEGKKYQDIKERTFRFAKEMKIRISNVLSFVLSSSKSGYSLLEVLVYGAIFGLFLLLTTQFFLTIKSMTANSFALVNLQQNYTRIFSDFNQTIRAAENVVSPPLGSSGNSLSLNSGEIVYQLNQGKLEKVVSGTPIELSDEGISIPTIVFENIGEATQTATIKIQMTIDSNYLLEGGRTVSEDFQTTIGLR